MRDVMRDHGGYCPICEREVTFHIRGAWLREEYFCTRCWSIPRQRAIIHVIQKFFQLGSNAIVHESSPAGMASTKLKQMFPQMTFSHYYPDVQLGELVNGFRCENLENMTFADQIFDLFVTQDVFEHVFNPKKAFAEVARVLKLEGIHIFTVPFYRNQTTKIRATRENDEIEYIFEPEYHQNPIDQEGGSLVVTEWGTDMAEVIKSCSGMKTTMYQIKDHSMGIDGEFLEVFVSRKTNA
ncbi:class I SAM-dependent methyltransferase [Hazenella sp. IB182357]|uniref:Class I SAM-dependent methyltransferase n=1 Tax=Polycladospora coralii TaxID=2771432 RepID=A0A926N6S3_9BACL|nr:class I SAM-dependent methyltransferase [Polycladospora coralii]MBD1373519.1 class I SAM-dependent methyltransferase [Polycladospora coralii]MBS7531887.1 class I SAM-dependent methyltransferase [Polycladospora coralii]